MQLGQRGPGRRALLLWSQGIGVIHIAERGGDLEHPGTAVGKRELVQIALDLEADRPKLPAAERIAQVVAGIPVHRRGQVARKTCGQQPRELAIQGQFAQTCSCSALASLDLACGCRTRRTPNQGQLARSVRVGKLQTWHLQPQAPVHPTPAQAGVRCIQRYARLIQPAWYGQRTFFDGPLGRTARLCGINFRVQTLHTQPRETGGGIGGQTQLVQLRLHAVILRGVPRALPLQRGGVYLALRLQASQCRQHGSVHRHATRELRDPSQIELSH